MHSPHFFWNQASARVSQDSSLQISICAWSKLSSWLPCQIQFGTLPGHVLNAFIAMLVSKIKIKMWLVSKSNCDWYQKFKIKLGLMSKINIKLWPCFGLKSSCARKKQIQIAMRLANLLFMTVQRQHIIHVLNLHGHTRCLHPMRFRQNPRVLTTDKTWLQQKHQLEGLKEIARDS